MKLYAYLLFMMIAISCSGPTSQKEDNSSDTNLNPAQVEEITALDSISTELKEATEQIESDIEKLEEVLKEIE